MSHHKEHHGGDSRILEFFMGAVLGGFIGTVIGLLLAPRAGEETRAQLADSMDSLQDKVGKILEETRMNSEDLIKSTRTTLEEKIAVLMDAVEAGKRAAGDKKREWFGDEEAGHEKGQLRGNA